MARADPEDDGIQRFIVHHYRYDPQRRERRHVVVAAFDNEAEFFACMEGVREEIERRRDRGESVDPREHASGTVHEPGYLRRAANGHLVMRALQRGVAPGPWLDQLEMPQTSPSSAPSALRPSAGHRAHPPLHRRAVDLPSPEP